ncbi:MAG: 23S rRNA (guanosine(2251)-2'-O)-methyltransferase RlmB [Acidobacteria bacterium]|nr:23S rRNA (guanosine(2251)-2'-O)-methyltransferase RlmB [Acidobacteriota bacterium]
MRNYDDRIRRRNDQALLYGIHPVREALQAGRRPLQRVILEEDTRNPRLKEIETLCRQAGVPVRFEKPDQLRRESGTIHHQGVVAVQAAQPYETYAGILARARKPALVLVLDEIEDPQNLGAILRTADAAGVDGVFIPERRAAGLSPGTARASAGAIQHVAVAQIVNVAQLLEDLKKDGFWIVGLDPKAKKLWHEVDYLQSIALVLGGEEKGIRHLVKEKCDFLARLPMQGGVASLNVSVAAGVVLYEILRQRASLSPPDG